MTDADRPTRHPAIETAVLGDEAVLYDERTGMVHYLNPSACAIWMLLDGRRVEEIIEMLAETPCGAGDVIRRDVLRAISELEAAGLIDG